MALFGSKKKQIEKAEAAVSTTTATTTQSFAHTLRHPRITEKATMHAQNGVYVFDIAVSATKGEVSAAVKKVYSVMPRMIRIVSVPTKYRRNARTGRIGVKTGGKKAYVYLKKGDTLNI
jgi:large subunit ribosomal protein L23